MNANRHLSVVGAGIVGLMTAYQALKRTEPKTITVYDEARDPRATPNLTHTRGATFSGLDARHVSFTETGPWTSAHRIDLIGRPAREGGWNCLSEALLRPREVAWVREFKRIARAAEEHRANYENVMTINRLGLDGWNRLTAEAPDLFRPTDDSRVLPIVCANEADLRGEQEAEHELDGLHVTEAAMALPDGLAPFRPLLGGPICGSFLVAGTAYNVKSLCGSLMTWLEREGVRFVWGRRIDLGRGNGLQLPDGDVVWTAGVSTKTARLLSEHGLLLQGVMGCWINIPNRGFGRPFKVLGLEPTNFINVTPSGDRLLLSGGYGWVGERTYEDAKRLGAPLVGAFFREVAKFFAGGDEANLSDCEQAVCLRPALPSGVPAVHLLPEVSESHRVAVCVGHAAGGFTQAPAVASRVLEYLDET